MVYLGRFTSGTLTCRARTKLVKGIAVLCCTTLLVFLLLQVMLSQQKSENKQENLFIAHQQKDIDTGSQIAHRKLMLQERCQSMNKSLPKYSDVIYRVLINQPRRLAMCYVPKTGCTFWKQVFYTLQARDKYGNKTPDIFKSVKYAVHYKRLDMLFDFKSFSQRFQFMSEAINMIFVRDPYSRLFSAYVDKLVLPEFWIETGSKIVEQTRSKPSALSLACGHDVTFEEFLRHVLLIAKGNFAYFGEEHWFPIYKLCHPCLYNYSIIGRQESYTSDRDWILKHLNLDHVRPDDLSWKLRWEQGMNDSILSTWTFRPRFTLCSNTTLLLERLWMAFQLQGYIPENMTYPLSFNQDYRSIHKLLPNLRKLVPTQEEFHRRREKNLKIFYRQIPEELMAQIREAFAYDFSLFGYDPKPSSLYGK